MNIQYRATRLAPNLRKLGYEYRMKKLKLTTLEIKRKMGDLIQFLSGHDHIKWKRRPEKIVHGDKDGTASRNLRRGGICFRREPANICTSRKEFFLNRVILIWLIKYIIRIYHLIQWPNEISHLQ